MSEALQNAIAKKVDLEMAPITAKVEACCGALRAYEEALRCETATRVSNAVLLTLGETVVEPATDGMVAAREQLRLALEDVRGLIDVRPAEKPAPAALPVPSQPALLINDPIVLKPSVAPPPAPLPSPPRLIHQLPAPPPPPAPPEHVMRAVERLRKELLELEGLTDPPERTRFVIQAMVAEYRQCLDEVPDGNNSLVRELRANLRHLKDLKDKAGIGEYIRGMANGSVAEWARVAADARRQVAQFDARGVNSPSHSKTKKAAGGKATLAAAFDWPAFPHLREAVKTKTLLLVGNIEVPEKETMCQKRFGLMVESCSAESVSGADSVARRVAGGTVCGVVLLEQFLSHSAIDKIRAACRAHGVPCGDGGRGGVGATEEALQTIDKKLGGQ